MTKLELLVSLHLRAGIAGAAPTTTIGQTGELALLVNLLDTAYEDIQNRSSTWEFLRHTFQFDTEIGTSEYVPSVAADFANWKDHTFRCYLTTTENEQELQQYRWDLFRDARLLGTARDTTGRPSEIAVTPEKALRLWPIPDVVYKITGEYYRKADTMTADADEPVFTKFHPVIMYGALMQYAGDLGLATLYATAQKEHKKLVTMMRREYLPKMQVGDALA